MSSSNRSEQQRTLFIGIKSAGFLLATFLLAILFAGEWQAAKVAAQEECGILAFEWDQPVTESSRGFPRQQPPINNFDWTKPVDYAHGTLHYRVEIKRQPEPQNMRLQLCFWQPETADAAYKFGLENCGPQETMQGNPGTVATWTRDVQDMWKKDGKLIDWTRARFRAGVAVKNSAGDPVSDYNGWNWNGEDPKKWYPLDMHFSAVVVPADGQFCGWAYYLDPTAVSLQQISTQTASNFIAPLLFAILTIITLLIWKIRPRKT